MLQTVLWLKMFYDIPAAAFCICVFPDSQGWRLDTKSHLVNILSYISISFLGFSDIHSTIIKNIYQFFIAKITNT